MKKSIQQFLVHLGVFALIEIIFVLIIFREFPETNLLTLVGLLHSSYRGIVLFAGWLREKYAHRVWQKILCTYLPLLYHVIIHVYAGIETVHEMTEHTGEHHDEQSMIWLIIGIVSAGVLIVLGEYRLHRTIHCKTHHISAHSHCHNEECEEEHGNIKH